MSVQATDGDQKQVSMVNKPWNCSNLGEYAQRLIFYTIFIIVSFYFEGTNPWSGTKYSLLFLSLYKMDI
jgi:hypothetical protein